VSLWKSRHVLCTTELTAVFLNPVVADCTCSTVLVFFGSQGKGKAVPVPCRHNGGLGVQLHTFFEIDSVVSFTPRPLYPQGKELPQPIE